jgi:hypothetical protein
MTDDLSENFNIEIINKNANNLGAKGVGLYRYSNHN